MRKIKFTKRLWQLSLCCCMGLAVKAQQPVDSSFHNYLYDSRTAYFKQLPVSKKAIVFFGDSITDWGDWAEFTKSSRVINRGIAGDNTFGLLGRLDEVLRHGPKKIFILIGTNDININGDAALPLIIRNYKKLIEAVRLKSPSTRIYVQSIFPINNNLINRKYYKGTNEWIFAANMQLKEMAKDMKVNYVDVCKALMDAQKQLDARYTYDGLHLSGLGYMEWVKYLKKARLL